VSWLTKISLRNRSIVGLAVLAVLLVGAFAITSLKEELIPDLTFPYLTVFTVDQGASARDVEQGVTTPLEQAIKTTSGVKEYDSFSNDGVSIITVQYEFGTDMKAKQAEVQQAVSGVQATLPATAQAPQVEAINFNSMPVVQLAVSSSLPPEQLAALLGTHVVPRLQGIAGVQAVTLSGVQQMQLQVQLDPKKVAALGISPAQISTALMQANVTTGAGTVTSGSLVYPVTVSATAQTLKAIEDLVLSPASTAAAGAATGAATGAGAASAAAGAQGGAGAASPAAAPAATGSPVPVRLGDVATVRIAPAPLTAVTRTNGKPSIGISVSKASSGNTVDIANAVAAELPAIDRDLRGQATVTTVVDQSLFIKDSIKSLLREGLIGALFAVVVIWLFLRSWRSTLIAGLSIPLSVVGALIILWSRGDSLNMLTLGGLTIAIGRVIDDSIVVIENIYRHLQEGDSIRSAAYTGTREVAGAITASTLTTVAVFLPLGFVHGLASEFFRPFALTVTFALLCSLAVALMVVPVVATWLLSKRQVGHRDEAELTHLQNWYLPALNWALNHKLATLAAAFAVFAGTMALVPMLKTNLFDSSGQNTMSITQTMPPGTSLDATMAAAQKVEAVLADTPGVRISQVTGGSTGSLFGAGGGTNASSSQATFAVTTDPNADKNAVIEHVRAQVAKLRNAGTITVTGEDSSMGGSMSQLEVRVSAADPAVLKTANDLVLARMQTVAGLADVSSNLSEGRPSATVIIDQAKAAAAGVTPSSLSQYLTLVLNGYPLGTVPTTAGVLPAQIMVGQITVPPLPGAVSKALSLIRVPGSAGMVPLSAVAKVVEVTAPVQVTHVDGARTASVTATSVDNNIGAASSAVTKALDGVKLPQGASWTLGGATQATNDVFRTLGVAMLIAILLVYIIMVGTFHSLLNPLILLVSIPFAAVGAVLALVVTGTSLGMPSLVGLLMLIGIVVTNAIVLLDLVEQFRRRGLDAREAVIEGGRRRLRPILMTAVATILALIPMALGIGGKGGFLSTPLAVVVIGGLFTSTFLTLILVPVLYLAFDRLRPAGAYERDEDDLGPSAARPAPAE
jgi:HAE1 family hydrophobic/amphiphilic exporter-1